jgi:hypothetical protein
LKDKEEIIISLWITKIYIDPTDLLMLEEIKILKRIYDSKWFDK